MQRRPIFPNRPVKPKKASAYRPGASAVCSGDDLLDVFPAPGLKRTARLKEKLEECRCGR